MVKLCHSGKISPKTVTLMLSRHHLHHQGSLLKRIKVLTKCRTTKIWVVLVIVIGGKQASQPAAKRPEGYQWCHNKTWFNLTIKTTSFDATPLKRKELQMAEQISAKSSDSSSTTELHGWSISACHQSATDSIFRHSINAMLMLLFNTWQKNIWKSKSNKKIIVKHSITFCSIHWRVWKVWPIKVFGTVPSGECLLKCVTKDFYLFNRSISDSFHHYLNLDP